MAHKCPRCGESVQRAYSSDAQSTAGLVGVLFYAAFGSFRCNKCGKIPFSEFPSNVQIKMAIMSLVLILSAIGVFIGAIALIAYINK